MFFENSDIYSSIISVAQRNFGILAIKPYQFLVIRRILEQQDEESSFIRNQVVILPTGTGKSLCFQIPALLCKKKTLIIYPLLALMSDQQKRMEKAGLPCVVIRGGQTKQERQAIFNKLRSGAKAVITNPETLCLPHVQKMLSEFEFELFVVDEAHIIYQWGRSFRPAYSNLAQSIKALKPHQILAFTATASPETLHFVEHSIFSSKPLLVRGDSDRENIYYSAVFSPSPDHAVFELLRNCKLPALVFCGQRKFTEILCLALRRTMPDLPSRFYHAGLSKSEREAIEAWFMACHDGVLFTTCAYGMGIDKSDIRTVIHYLLPATAEEYLQESGRAGRDGARAWAFAIISQDNSSGQLYRLFTSSECRRKALLKCLGEDKEECSGCDVCTGIALDFSEITNALVKLIRRFPLRYTEQSAVALLTGTRIKWKLEASPGFNPFFGLLDKFSFEEVLETLHSCPLIKVTKGPGKRLYAQKPQKKGFVSNTDRFLKGKSSKRGGSMRILSKISEKTPP